MSSIDIVKQRILARVPLAALFGESLELKVKGRLKWACCPFHGEKTPSLAIYDDHFHCYGCQKHGDAIDFARHQFGLSFVEALRFLAKKYNIETPELEENAKDRERQNTFAKYFRALNLAHKHFCDNLRGPQGDAARSYLSRRGFKDEAVADMGFGLALAEPDDLVRALRKLGVHGQDLAACSLAYEKGKFYDYFRNRLMIPIQDRHGRVIAFGGRTLGNDDAKYINSRECDVYSKSYTLFGLHKAREPIRQKKRALVVEGYMDTLQLWNHGFTETVACLGTALTVEQLRQLAPVTSHVILVFDGDAAGRKATLRTVSLALELHQIKITVLRLPEKDDPDSFLQREGAAAFEQKLAATQDLLEFAITEEIKGAHDLAIPELVKQKFVPWLMTVSDSIHRAFLAGRIADLTGIPAASLQQAVTVSGKKTPPAERAGASGRPTDPALRAVVIARKLLPLEHEVFAHLFFSEPGALTLTDVKQFVTDELDLDEIWLAFAVEMIDCLAAGIAPATKDLSDWSGSASETVLKWLTRIAGQRAMFQSDNRQNSLFVLRKALRRQRLQASIMTFRKQLATPELSHEESLQILQAINKLNQELTQLNN